MAERRKMTGTVTIRLPGEVLRRLRNAARASGRTPSELVRAALERELGGEAGDGRTALERTRRWVGSVSRGKMIPGRSAREALDEWNPDRRG